MRKLAAIIAALVLIAFVVAINITDIREAFGDGSPYYGRTTNMDKWSNPVPMLAMVDIATVVVVGAMTW